MKNSIEAPPAFWVALSIGNTHWRWGYFEGPTLLQHWTIQPPQLEKTSLHLDWPQYCELSPAFAWHQKRDRPSFPPLYLASVVNSGQRPWLHYPNLHTLTLQDIPMKGLYDTLGIDRALAVLGGGNHYGWPILVIDAGTALTLSGAHAGQFKGGAIAPGLGLQLKILKQNTAALPHVQIPLTLPPRWANNTPDAMLSGVIHSILDSIIAFHQAWIDQHPNSSIVLTGGDGPPLISLLQEKFRQASHELGIESIYYDEQLIFKGMSAWVAQQKRST